MSPNVKSGKENRDRRRVSWDSKYFLNRGEKPTRKRLGTRQMSKLKNVFCVKKKWMQDNVRVCLKKKKKKNSTAASLN